MEPADTPVPWLMFGTLAIALIVAIVLFTRFMRKPRNRHPMRGQPERDTEEIRREGSE